MERFLRAGSAAFPAGQVWPYSSDAALKTDDAGGKLRDHCWHLGCILPNNRANSCLGRRLGAAATVEAIMEHELVDRHPALQRQRDV